MLPCPLAELFELPGEFCPGFSEPTVSPERPGDGVMPELSGEEPEPPGIREMMHKVTSRIQTATMV